MGKKIVILLIIFFVVFAFFAYRNMGGASVIISFPENDDLRLTTVFVDNKEVLTRNDIQKTFVIDKVKGTKTITIKRAGYRDFVKNISVSRNKVTINPTFIEATATEVVGSLENGSFTKESQISDISYFGNREWIAFNSIYSDTSKGKTSVIVRYDKPKSKWIVLNFGDENEVEPVGNGYIIPEEIMKKYVLK